MANELELGYGVRLTNPAPVDAIRTKPQSGLAPALGYASVAEACSLIAQAVRYDGLTVMITGVGEYWWQAPDFSDAGLLAKGGGTTLTPDQLAAIQAGDNPSATNAFVTESFLNASTGTVSSILIYKPDGTVEILGIDGYALGYACENAPTGSIIRLNTAYFEATDLIKLADHGSNPTSLQLFGFGAKVLVGANGTTTAFFPVTGTGRLSVHELHFLVDDTGLNFQEADTGEPYTYHLWGGSFTKHGTSGARTVQVVGKATVIAEDIDLPDGVRFAFASYPVTGTIILRGTTTGTIGSAVTDTWPVGTIDQRGGNQLTPDQLAANQNAYQPSATNPLITSSALAALLVYPVTWIDEYGQTFYCQDLTLTNSIAGPDFDPSNGQGSRDIVLINRTQFLTPGVTYGFGSLLGGGTTLKIPASTTLQVGALSNVTIFNKGGTLKFGGDRVHNVGLFQSGGTCLLSGPTYFTDSLIGLQGIQTTGTVRLGPGTVLNNSIADTFTLSGAGQVIDERGAAPQWVAGRQLAGTLVYNAGYVYRVQQDIANGQAAPTATNQYYLQLGAGGGGTSYTAGRNIAISAANVISYVPTADTTSCRVTSGNQPNGTFTALASMPDGTVVNFDMVVEDPGNNFNVTDNYYLVPVAGKYEFIARLRWADNTPAGSSYAMWPGSFQDDSSQALFGSTTPKRSALLNVYQAHLAAGTKIYQRVFADGFSATACAELVIRLIRAD